MSVVRASLVLRNVTYSAWESTFFRESIHDLIWNPPFPPKRPGLSSSSYSSSSSSFLSILYNPEFNIYVLLIIYETPWRHRRHKPHALSSLCPPLHLAQCLTYGLCSRSIFWTHLSLISDPVIPPDLWLLKWWCFKSRTFTLFLFPKNRGRGFI